MLGGWGPRIRVKGIKSEIVEKLIDLVGAVSTDSAVNVGFCGVRDAHSLQITC